MSGYRKYSSMDRRFTPGRLVSVARITTILNLPTYYIFVTNTKFPVMVEHKLHTPLDTAFEVRQRAKLWAARQLIPAPTSPIDETRLDFSISMVSIIQPSPHMPI